MTSETSGGAFERLRPALQYHLVNSLGFTALRPVQELAIHAVLDGDNCVVLAPTAGGKTEAAFLPLLSQMEGQGWPATSVLYLAPIKALLNNQEARLERYAGLLGRRVFKWHGDVGMTLRRRFIAEPADILLTTPESLEVMLMSANVPSRRLFAHLQAVVIDEIHAFAGDDRGAHLVALLERLARHAGRDLQRIGLSATVGNPEEILGWLRGSSGRPGRLVDPPRAGEAPEVHLDHVGSLGNAAHVIAALHRGGKRVVFVDSRRRVEQLGELLRRLGTTTFLTHSALSADERHRAEQAFESGKDCVIVATSTLELGVDVGDLDAVLQVDAPPSVSSFLQRMGRSGRRPGQRRGATLLATNAEELALSAALLRLWRAGYVESVEPERNAYHVLAQQMMALSIQEGGVPVADVWGWLAGAAAFADTTEAGRGVLLEKMLAEDILYRADGRLMLGRRGERLYGWRHFEALYAVFQVPPQLRVLWGPDDIGSIDAFFMQGMPPEACFYLAGKAWRVQRIDWDRGQCWVEPAPHGKHLSWLGRPRFLSRIVAQAVRGLLLDEAEDACWTERARGELGAYRRTHEFLQEAAMPLVEHHDRIEWHTFLGGRANNLLGRMLRERLGEAVVADNFMIVAKEGAARSLVAMREETEALLVPGRITHEDALRHAASCVRGRLSKFQPCLPAELELEFIAARVVERPERPAQE